MSTWIAALMLLCFVLPLSGVSAFECNDLKKFRCRKGKNAKANGCTWARDKFKAYRHFPAKKRLFGVCMNAGESESQHFGTPAERCDCGTKCMRKCKFRPGYKKSCYWAGPRLTGTCLPTSHFDTGPAYTAIDGANFQTAVDAWVADSATATSTYGDISTWDTSSVTSMREAFYWASNFNADISTWVTSSVTDMKAAFRSASAFNGDISTWDTSKVTDMNAAFFRASDFNADISTWDTSSVTDMEVAFRDASAFNADISTWDTSSVTTMEEAFKGASAFNADLSTWDTNSVMEYDDMLKSAAVFDCSNNLPSTFTTSSSSCNN